MIFSILSSACSTTWQRLSQGAACPSWSFKQELIVGVLREVNQSASLESSRANTPDNPPVPGTVAIEATGCPVPAVWVQPDNNTKPEASSSSSSGGNVVIYLHGGAFVQGSIKSYRTIASKIALATGARVLLLEYRLAPEHKFPAPLEDTVAAYKWLLQAEQGYTPARVAFMGDSSGGNVVLASALQLARAQEPLPGFLAVLSPTVDLSGSIVVEDSRKDYLVAQRKGYNAALLYAGSEEALRNTLISPLLADDLNILAPCPILVECGAVELLHPRIAAFSVKAKAAGCKVDFNEYADAPHVFQQLAAFFPEAAAKSFEAIGAFSKSHFPSS